VRRIVVVCVTVASLAAIGLLARMTAPTPRAVAQPMRFLCGMERWPVKTFNDGDRWQVDLTRRWRTIEQLNALTKPKPLPQNGRATGEGLTYIVTGTVTFVANEDDGDIHLAIASPSGASLIAEAPEPGCTAHARNRAAMNSARLAAQDIQVGDKVRAAGVGFFDFNHGQNGRARNDFELHPLLSIKRL
jgi:hypothetical protein